MDHQFGTKSGAKYVTEYDTISYIIFDITCGTYLVQYLVICYMNIAFRTMFTAPWISWLPSNGCVLAAWCLPGNPDMGPYGAHKKLNCCPLDQLMCQALEVQ